MAPLWRLEEQDSTYVAVPMPRCGLGERDRLRGREPGADRPWLAFETPSVWLENEGMHRLYTDVIDIEIDRLFPELKGPTPEAVYDRTNLRAREWYERKQRLDMSVSYACKGDIDEAVRRAEAKGREYDLTPEEWDIVKMRVREPEEGESEAEEIGANFLDVEAWLRSRRNG